MLCELSKKNKSWLKKHSNNWWLVCGEDKRGTNRDALFPSLMKTSWAVKQGKVKKQMQIQRQT